MNQELVVIGGGPGGYVAAIRAAQLGAKVLLIEQDEIGGVCLNHGCIPTKTLLNSAEQWTKLRHCSEFGLTAESISFDFAKIMARKAAVVTKLRDGISKLLASQKIEVIHGTARLTGKREITVQSGETNFEVTADKLIIATGSNSVPLPVPGAGLPGVIDSNQILSLTEVPKKLLIVGAGAVGIEFAAIFQSFGCEVTVVEMMPTILPGMDSDLAKRLGPILRRSGMKLMTNAAVKEIRRAVNGLEVIIETKRETAALTVDKVLAAIGRRSRVEDLGLAAAGINYTKRGIAVDEHMATNVCGVYAIGDVTGSYLWAHAASAEGIVAAEHACGLSAVMHYEAIPGCIFTTPEIAAVGLTEEEAQKQHEILVSRFNFAANGKAVSLGESDGFVKIVADAASHEVLGMHILGPHASDLIMEGALAIRQHLTSDALATTIHPHPTLSETLEECAQGIGGLGIHQLKLR